MKATPSATPRGKAAVGAADEAARWRLEVEETGLVMTVRPFCGDGAGLSDPSRPVKAPADVAPEALGSNACQTGSAAA